MDLYLSDGWNLVTGSSSRDTTGSSVLRVQYSGSLEILIPFFRHLLENNPPFHGNHNLMYPESSGDRITLRKEDSGSGFLTIELLPLTDTCSSGPTIRVSGAWNRILIEFTDRSSMMVKSLHRETWWETPIWGARLPSGLHLTVADLAPSQRIYTEIEAPLCTTARTFFLLHYNCYPYILDGENWGGMEGPRFQTYSQGQFPTRALNSTIRIIREGDCSLFSYRHEVRFRRPGEQIRRGSLYNTIFQTIRLDWGGTVIGNNHILPHLVWRSDVSTLSLEEEFFGRAI